MKRRYQYSLLFGIPGCLISVILSVIIFFGILDIFSNRMSKYHVPSTLSEKESLIMPVVIFVIIWVLLTFAGYLMGTTFEDGSSLNRKHILISAGLTLILFIFVLRWGTKNFGYQADGDLCGEFCFRHGYNTGILSPMEEKEKTCYCSDWSTGEKITVPLESIDPDSLK